MRSSLIQEQFWLIDQIYQNTAYNLPLVYQIKGNLDEIKLISAIEEEVKSNDVYFFKPIYVDKRLILQQTERNFSVIIEKIETSNNHKEELIKLAKNEVKNNILLSNGETIRAKLYRFSPANYGLVIVIHHFSADWNSKALLINNISKRYNQIKVISRNNYPDFTKWQLNWIESSDFNKKLFESKKFINPDYSLVNFPANRETSQTKRDNLGIIEGAISEDTHEIIKKIANQNKVSPFIITLSSYYFILSYIAKSNNFTIGVPFTNRLQDKWENTQGCFVNILPISIENILNSGFSELVEQIRKKMLFAHRCQEIPIEQLANHYGVKRNTNQNVFFQYGFTYEELIPLELNNLSTDSISISRGAPQLDNFLFLWHDKDKLKYRFEYDADILKESDILYLSGLFKDSFELVFKQPESILSSVKFNVNHRYNAKTLINITGTFTTEPINKPLNFWLDKINLPANINFVGYNQVFQQLLDPNSNFNAGKNQVNIVFVRPEDFFVNNDSINKNYSKVSGELSESILTHVQINPTNKLMVVFCPPSNKFKQDYKFSEICEELEADILQLSEENNNLNVIRLEDFLISYKLSDYYEPIGEKQGHIPYKDNFFACAATLIVRKLNSHQLNPFKAIVLDCDNTLWRGVVGEDGPIGVTIGEPEKELQKFLIDQYNAGILLCLCSKNNENEVWDVFEKNKQMLLKREHISFSRINWEPKSGNIISLSKEINIGLDSFVFIDDNPVECEEVKANAPSVLTIQKRTDTDNIDYIINSWVFDRNKITQEDKKRALMYKNEAERINLKTKLKTYKEFIKELQIDININPVSSNELTRASQLTFRTNQFNFTTIRRTEDEIKSLLDNPEYHLHFAQLKDRYGEYGIVGVIICSEKDDSIHVDTFLLSCRALGKGVEHAMIAHAGAIAKAKKKNSIEITFFKTEKNTVAEKFLNTHFLKYKIDSAENLLFVIPTENAVEFKFDPFLINITNEDSDIIQNIEIKPIIVNRNNLFVDIIENYSDIDLIVQNIYGKDYTPGRSQIELKLNRTQIKSQVLNIWREVLNNPDISVNDNFFDVGGESILIPQIVVRLKTELDISVNIIDVFQYPNVNALSEYILPSANDNKYSSEEPINKKTKTDLKTDEIFKDLSDTDNDIAIIGLTGRFPGADNIQEFWQLIKSGKEAITHYSREELENKGVPKELLDNPNYVYSAGSIPTADKFDAAFFGFTPREADFMDPQHRIFLESCHEALELAGYSSDRYNGSIGVFAGSGPDNYILKNLIQHGDALRNIGEFQTIINNGKDFLTTHVSYKLNLNGPSINIQTACSTSLVALHYACNSLLSKQSDIALAGGAFVQTPREIGYMYEPGGIFSPKGQCRPFDNDADGTLFGEGVGVVVLKCLQDAVRDNDTIWAIIKGSAVNNDGDVKVGYMAPSVTGQSRVVSQAQNFAGIKPSDISYIEAHGTGTNLGDPIEVNALTKVFSEETQGVGFCAIGSVKANIGHLDAAAGIAGVIKTTLALKYKQIPPVINFIEPNPELQINESPFYVNTELKKWDTDGKPRIAGISSFGIGGTNAHCILQEADESVTEPGKRKYHIIPVSAKTETALNNIKKNLVNYLIKNECSIPDLSYTLLKGRKRFKYRSTVICVSQPDIIEKILDAPVKTRQFENPRIVFLFTGQGSQYNMMAKGLYDEFPVFKECLDKAFVISKSCNGPDLEQILFSGEYKSEINRTEYAQPALFTIQYGIAKLLNSFGITANALIGHSIGEVTAACVSGLFSFEDGLKLVITRGRLMQAQKPGAMLSIQLPADKVKEILPRKLDFALQNAPNFSVVSGDFEDIKDFHNHLALEYPDIMISQLNTSHAFHSRMMDPALDEFRKEIAGISFNNINIPFISNTTGTWVNKQVVGNLDYWVNHIRSTVNFVDGVNTLLEDKNTLFIEVGPGVMLTTLLAQFETDNRKIISVPTVRHPRKKMNDIDFFLEGISSLWSYGADNLFDNWYDGERRKRIPLPTYPFERKRHWIDPIIPFSYHIDTKNVYSNLQQSNDIGISGQTEQIHEISTTLHKRPELTSSFTPPANEIEKKIVQIWQKLLGIKDIGVDDDFFELGGHSLLASSLLIQINKEFGVTVRLQDLNSDSVSVKQISELITRNSEVQAQVKPNTKYKILVKKTNEITENEWLIYIKEFNRIFNRNYSKEDFIRKYTVTPLGFSFHCLVYVDNNLVGAQSHIVKLFNYKKEVIRIASGCDLFIMEEYRKSFTLLYDLWKAADSLLMEHNVKAHIGNPLPELMVYHETAQTGFQLISRLSTYLLPLTFKVVHPVLGFLDLLYRPLLHFILTVRSLNKSSIHKDEKLFKAHEYYSPYDYKTFQEHVGDLKFSWLWSNIKHLKIIIINDNFKSKGDVFTASKYLIKKHGNKAKAITFFTTNKLPLPFKLFQKRELFIGKLLSDDINSDDFFDINNWEFCRGFFD